MAEHVRLDVSAIPLTQKRVRSLDSLTSLRAFAAFAVFALHAQELLPAGAGGQWLTRQGGVGVPFFFILSGFVLTWSARGQDSARDFYRRRVGRIVPAYLVAAVLVVPVILLEGGDVARRLGEATPSLTLVQAWVPDPSIYFGGNGVLWSLSVEALFYALFPAAIPLARRLSARAAGCAVVLLLAAETIWQLAWWRALPGTSLSSWARLVVPIAHLPEFGTGILLALLFQAGYLTWVRLSWTLPLALAGYAASGLAVNNPLILAPLALLIVSAANSDSRHAWSMLRARWLVVLGEWSYCFYLLHQLVIRTIYVTAFRHHAVGGLRSWICWVVALLLSVALAAVLHKAVERPFARKLRRDGHRPAERATNPIATGME